MYGLIKGLDLEVFLSFFSILSWFIDCVSKFLESVVYCLNILSMIML